MSVSCWATVGDGGPTWKRHRVSSPGRTGPPPPGEWPVCHPGPSRRTRRPLPPVWGVRTSVPPHNLARGPPPQYYHNWVSEQLPARLRLLPRMQICSRFSVTSRPGIPPDHHTVSMDLIPLANRDLQITRDSRWLHQIPDHAKLL